MKCRGKVRGVALVGLLLASSLGAQSFEARSVDAVLGEEHIADSKVPPMNEAIRSLDGRIQVIVEFDEPAIAMYGGGIQAMRATSPRATGAAKLDMAAPATAAYGSYLAGRAADRMNEIAAIAPSIEFTHQYNVVMNGVGARVSELELNAIAAMPGVKRIYPDRMVYASMDASLPLVNAPTFWRALGGRDNAGRGIKVAIVDGGIRPENPMFSGADFDFPPGYPLADDYCGAVDPSFCNGKLIVARHFNAGVQPLHPLEVDSPLGINGHGTHVAGTAVGNFVAGATNADGVPEDISGVAPGAWLMAYKGLWWNGTTGSGSTSDLIAAVNAAVADGADVINNSWGGAGGADPRTSAFKPIFDAANAAGVLSVVAAGNAGPGATTVGCPGCIETALTVANSTTNRMHALAFDLDGGPTGLGCLVGTGPAFTGPVGTTTVVYAGDVGDFQACSALPAGSMDGAIGLISRGSCSFATKVANAEAAGAVGAVVFNSVAGAPITMGGLNAGETIPSCMISDTDGADAVAHVQANPGGTGIINFPASRITNDNWQNLMATSSSRGPNGNPDFLKPDIAAPGTRIFSAESPDAPNGDGSIFSFKTGTSMASPHVAGAAALMLQLHPDWTPEQVKTALTSTSSRVLVKEDTVTPSDPFDRGTGRLDLAKALRAGATFDLPSMADPACVQNCTFERTIQNELPFRARWSASTDSVDPDLGITVSPSTVFLGPGESTTFQVSVNTEIVDANAWQFGDVIWSAGPPRRAGKKIRRKFRRRNVSDAVLPIAVFSSGSSNSAVMTKTVDLAEASPYDVLTYNIDITNSTFQDPIDLVDFIPDNATYVDGSAMATVDGVADPNFVYDPVSNSLTWSGTLDPLTLEITASPSPFGYFALSNFFAPLGCSSVCDDTSTTLSGVGPFTYLGATYTSLVMGSNGMFVPGTDTTSAFTPFNQTMPDPTPPNVIAPFWTDFDMDGTSATDTGNGIWYAGILSTATTSYTVLEWANAELFGNPGLNYTLQVWIENNTSNIWFVYNAVPAIPTALTVGAENSTGQIGTNYFVNGTGTAPAVGTDLFVGSAPGGAANLTFQATVGCLLDPVVNVAELTSGEDTVTAFAGTKVVSDGLAVCIEGSCPGAVTITGSGATVQRGKRNMIQLYTGEAGSSTIPVGPCRGTELDLDLFGPLRPPIRPDGSGQFEAVRYLSPEVCGQLLQAVDKRTCSPSDAIPLP